MRIAGCGICRWLGIAYDFSGLSPCNYQDTCTFRYLFAVIPKHSDLNGCMKLILGGKKLSWNITWKVSVHAVQWSLGVLPRNSRGLIRNLLLPIFNMLDKSSEGCRKCRTSSKFIGCHLHMYLISDVFHSLTATYFEIPLLLAPCQSLARCILQFSSWGAANVHTN